MSEFYGEFGGAFVPEMLEPKLKKLEEAYELYKNDAEFQAELKDLLDNYANRPSLLYFAKNMTKDLGGAKIYLKREDLNHTGAHKVNNVMGQALLAKKMGMKKLIAETGAGQHGVATATAAAYFGMECDVYMGEEDMKRQSLNVYRMRLLGATVYAATTGTRTLKEAVDEAIMAYAKGPDDLFYLLGSAVGPHPYPTIVADFQSVISKEIKEQLLEKEGKLPTAVVACCGGGSNAIGAFLNFIDDKNVRLIGVEGAGKGIDTPDNAATITLGTIGAHHGYRSLFNQDENGELLPVYSISAGLDYPGVGPQHAYLNETGRGEYVSATDDEAVAAFEYLSKVEGIIPAIESSHAIAHAIKIAPTMAKDDILVINLSGRGDKDVAAIARYRGEDLVE